MMPGGYANRGERRSHAASRELFEEAGVRASKLRPVSYDGDTAFYTTHVRLPRSRHGRMRMFSERPERGRETKDYGFVDPSSNTLVVTDYSGRVKSRNPRSFRKGTVSQLRKTSARRRRDDVGRSSDDVGRSLLIRGDRMWKRDR